MLSSCFTKFWILNFLRSKHLNLKSFIFLERHNFKVRVESSQNDLVGMPFIFFNLLNKDPEVISNFCVKPFKLPFKNLCLFELLILNSLQNYLKVQNGLIVLKTYPNSFIVSNFNIFTVLFLYKVEYSLFLKSNFEFYCIKDFLILKGYPLMSCNG